MKNLKMELTESAREKIYQSVLDSSHLDLEYVAMLAFAGLIALFGLLQNSVAVIIGAMLISPLMNPVLAAALALILGDWSVGRRAASVLAWSIGGVIALTWLVAWLTPLKQVTPEILARTNPNLLDMLVAVLAGLARLRSSQNHREPLSKAVSDGLFELRHLGKLNTRVFWFFRKGRRIIAVHGIRNKRRAIPARDLATARARMADGKLYFKLKGHNWSDYWVLTRYGQVVDVGGPWGPWELIRYLFTSVIPIVFGCALVYAVAGGVVYYRAEAHPDKSFIQLMQLSFTHPPFFKNRTDAVEESE